MPTSSISQRSARSPPPPQPSPACGGGNLVAPPTMSVPSPASEGALLGGLGSLPPPQAGEGWGGGLSITSRASISARRRETDCDNSSLRPGASPSQNGML